MRQFDAEVAIVGGGPAGSVLAILLGRSGVRTLLLDRARFPRDKPCGEGLMPAGVEALDEIGVTLDRYPHLRGVTYRLPGSGSASGTFAGTHGGRGTRRLVLDEELFRLAGRSPNVDAHEGCTVSGVAAGSGKVVVKTASGEVSARIV